MDQLVEQISDPERAASVLETVGQYRRLPPDGRERELPAIYLFLEQYLAEFDSNPGLTRARIRDQVRERHPAFLDRADFGPLFEAAWRQEVFVCRRLLEGVLERYARHPGRVEDGLEPLLGWIREVPEAGDCPLPLRSDAFVPDGPAHWVPYLEDVSEAVYGRLEAALGPRPAGELYENAYSEVAATYRGLDAFPVVIKLLPDRLLDGEKIRLLSRSQMQRVLMDKMNHLQSVNEELSEKNRELERARVELELAQEELTGRVYRRTKDLQRANEKLRQEVLEKAQAEKALRESEVRFRSVVESAIDAIVLVDQWGKIILWNRTAEQVFGYRWEEIIGQPFESLLPERLHPFLDLRPGSDGGFEGRRSAGRIEETVGRRRDGTEFPLEISMATWVADDAVYHSGIIRDISERLRNQERLQILADHDPLTNLYNRRRFREELERQLALGRRHKTPGALLFMDLDEFKDINDTLGHRVGDELIKTIASLIKGRIRQGDTLARLGGDEFALFLPQTPEASAALVASNLLDEIRHHTISVGGRRVGGTVSIGIAAFPDHGTTVEELLARADLAMYEAKDHGRNRYRIYTTGADRRALVDSRLAWERRIREALDRDLFVIHCQPIVELATGRVASYEALLRMQGPAGEIVPPESFLGVAERYGLIQDIDRWVLRKAIELMARAGEEGQEVSLCVNLSAKAFSDGDLLTIVAEELATSGIEPSRLTLEITESAAIADLHHARHFVESLRTHGCRFALDDFGIGFSSFHNLKHLPVDYLKIDGSFIQNLSRNSVDQHLVQAIVEVARGLGQKTIAEFVHDEETAELLRSYGVDYGQGFHMGRPLPLHIPPALAATGTEE